MGFLDNALELILLTGFFGVVTAVIFLIIAACGGMMIHDEKDDSNFSMYFVGFLAVTFVIANIIGFIVNVKHVFFT